MIDLERKIQIEGLLTNINNKWINETKRKFTWNDASSLYYLYETKNEEIYADLEKNKGIDTMISLLGLVEVMPYTQDSSNDYINKILKNRKEKKTLENIYLYLDKMLQGITSDDISFIVRSIRMPKKDIENAIIMSYHYEEDRAREIDFFNYLCDFFMVDDVTLINRIGEVKEIDKYIDEHKKENESKLKVKSKKNGKNNK